MHQPSYSRMMIEVSNQLRVFRLQYMNPFSEGDWIPMVYQTNVYILPETNSSHLKWMVGIFLLGWLIFRGYVSFRESKYNMRILLSRKHVWINNWRHKCPLWWGLNPCITWIRRLFCQKEVDWFQVRIYRGILWYDFPFVQRFGDMIFFFSNGARLLPSAAREWPFWGSSQACWSNAKSSLISCDTTWCRLFWMWDTSSHSPPHPILLQIKTLLL